MKSPFSRSSRVSPSTNKRHRRRLLIEQFETRRVLAPVATEFPIGIVPLGTSLRIEAADIVSDFGTDSASNLQSSSVTFLSASVNGGAARPLTDVGFAFLTGAGKAGTIVLNTGMAPAFSGLAVGATANVSIGFRVSDGTLSDTDVLTYAVTRRTAIADSVTIEFLGNNIAGREIKAEAITTTTASVLDVGISGIADVSDGLAKFDLTKTFELVFPSSPAFALNGPSQQLTIAAAFADNGSDANASATNQSHAFATANASSSATATASNDSTATATATRGSTATSDSNLRSVANSMAEDSSVVTSSADIDSESTTTAVSASAASATSTSESKATADANNASAADATSDGGSMSEATADDSSVATAFATVGSNANADALDGAAAVATAGDESTALATTTGGSAANATASSNSSATATASDLSTATANAYADSTAVSEASRSSVAMSVAIDNSAASADANLSSDALAAAKESSVASASSDISSSSSAGADVVSAASATSTDNSAAVSAATDASVASATAADDSVALGVASLNSNSVGWAQRGSTAQGIALYNSLANATANDSSAADAAANHDLVSTGTLAQAISEMTAELVFASARGRDVVDDMLAVATGGVGNGDSIAKFIDEALGRNPSAQLTAGNVNAMATADFSSLATSVSINGLSSTADADNFMTSRARSGSPTVTNFSIATAASGVTGQGTNLSNTASAAPILGRPGVPVALPITLSQLSSDPVDSIVLSGFPTGTVLSAGTSSNGGTTWTFNSAPPSNLTFTTSAGAFLLNITARNGNNSVATSERLVMIASTSSYSIAPTDANKLEGHTGTTPFTFTVTRHGVVTGASTVNYAVSGVAADFASGVLPTGQISFSPGETSKVLTINVAGDRTVESNDIFRVNLAASATGTTVSPIEALGLIRNDDTNISIVPLNADRFEGATATTPFTFRVARSGDVSTAATVSFNVVGSGTNAASADDFGGTLPSGTVSFAANQSFKDITINVSGDVTVEPDESFNVVLSNPSGGILLGTSTAPGVIRNDDTSFAIAATSANKAEGNSGTTPFTFTVTRTGVTTNATSLNFAVTGSGATPAQASDFADGVFPSGQVVFAANETSKVVTILVQGNTVLEANEGFTVTLADAIAGTTITTATAIGTILNDDTALALVATSANKAEGISGSTAFTFTVTRSGNLAGATNVNFAVTGSSPSPAQANDFAGGVFPTGQVAFAANETSKVITVNVLGNTVAEANEGFTVTLSGASGGATITTAAAAGLIRNDDTALAIAATSANKAEGNTGSTPFTFTVTRSGNVAGATTVNFAVSGNGTTPAQASDFVGGVFPSGQVSFAANETSKLITVNVLGDSTIEANEGFRVTLSNASAGATILTAAAIGVIQNDENSVSIAATSANKLEGNSGTTPFTFTVTRLGNIATPSTVNFAVTGSGTTPAQASDFVGGVFPSGRVSFAANETSKVITIPVRGDTTVEASESFAVTLSGATAGFSLTTPTATGLIQSDDTSLAIAATSASKAEGNTGSTAFTFTVTRSGVLTRATSVNFAVAGSGATPVQASDFVGNRLPSGVVTFAAGETSKVITIQVVGDRVVEANEGFVVNLSGATSGVTLATASAAGLIRNDDTAVSIVATNADQFEPTSGSSAFTFTVSRTGLTTGTSSVNFAVVGSGSNPASAGDFVGGRFPSGTVAFAPGETSKVITIQVASDNLAEVNEGFTVNLSMPSAGVTLGTASASGIVREGCLSGGPLIGGDNVLTYSCGTPGTIVGFAMGSGPGKTNIAQHGVQLDIAGATVIGTGVVDASGRARIVVRLTAAQAASLLYFQAFEIAPTVKKSNVFID